MSPCFTNRHACYKVVKQLLVYISILSTSYALGQPKSTSNQDSANGDYAFINRLNSETHKAKFDNDKLEYTGSYKTPTINGASQIHYKNGKLLANIILKDDYVYSYEEFYLEGTRALKINFSHGLYKNDYLALISKMVDYTDENINRFILTLNKYYDDKSYASISIPSKAQLNLDHDQYLAAWDSIRFVCAGVISGECTISKYDIYGHIVDSIIYYDGREVFKAKTSYYETVKMNKVFEKQIYQNGFLSKTYSYETTGKSFEIKNYYKSGKVESGGMIRRGKRVGRWNFYNEKGRVLRIEKYKKGLLVSTITNP